VGYLILAVIAASLLLALVVTQWRSRNTPGPGATDAHHQSAVDRYRRGGGDGGIGGPQG
jgi:hypothetical protein